MNGVAVLLVVCSALGASALPMLTIRPAFLLQEASNTLVDLAKKENLTTLVKLATDAGLAKVLESKTLTLFGPTDAAFQAIPPEVKDLIKDKTVLKKVLMFHVLKGKVYSSAIKNDLLVASLEDSEIRFNIYGKIVTAQCSLITKVNLNASNGVLHELSRVMVPPLYGNIVGFVREQPQHFSTLLAAVVEATLDGVLEGEGPFTVFAPSNAAFTKIPKEELDKILHNIPLLTKILEYHVVSGTFCSAGLTDKAKVETLSGSDVTIHVSKGGVMVNKAKVVFSDAPVSNGVVHVIDTVLIPPEVEAELTSPETANNLVDLAKKEKLEELLKLATKADIAKVLSMSGVEFTLFGPSDGAFNAVNGYIKERLMRDIEFLKEVLLYHVIRGRVFAGAIKNDMLEPSVVKTSPPLNIRFNVYGDIVTAQCSPITKVNLNASNGVLHELSRVMLPPGHGPITGLINNMPHPFSTLKIAIEKAGLGGALSGEGPFTIFAPTDGAFSKIPKEELDKILKNIPLLTKILKYHVVSGTFCSAGLTDNAKLKTLAGSDVDIHVTKEGVTINDDGKVQFADASVSNGVLHAIEAVLLPPDVIF